MKRKRKRKIRVREGEREIDKGTVKGEKWYEEELNDIKRGKTREEAGGIKLSL
jgi:hypothetical protein